MDAKPNPIARSGKSGSGRPKPFAYEQALGEWRAACACAQRQSLLSHRLAADHVISSQRISSQGISSRCVSSQGSSSQLVVVGTDGSGQPRSSAYRSQDSAHLRASAPRDDRSRPPRELGNRPEKAEDGAALTRRQAGCGAAENAAARHLPPRLPPSLAYSRPWTFGNRAAFLMTVERAAALRGLPAQ